MKCLYAVRCQAQIVSGSAMWNWLVPVLATSHWSVLSEDNLGFPCPMGGCNLIVRHCTSPRGISASCTDRVARRAGRHLFLQDWERMSRVLCRVVSAGVDSLAHDAPLFQLRHAGPPVSLAQGPPHCQWGQGRAVGGVLCSQRVALQHAERQQLTGNLHLICRAESLPTDLRSAE